MSEFTAQAKGVAKQLASALKGRPGIYATLAKEHGEVSSLMRQALRTASANKRSEILDKVRVELISHSRAEERTLYRALQEFADTRQPAISNESEHREAEDVLREVFAAEGQSAQQDRNIERLIELVEDHAKDEEEVLFVRANELLSEAREKELDRKFQEQKEAEKRRLEADGIGFADGPVSTASSHHWSA